MTIKVYPALTPCDPIEEHEFSGKFSDWLNLHEIDYKLWTHQPITVIVNDDIVDVGDWSELTLSDDDIVEIRPLPHGGVFKALGGIIGAVFGFAFGWLFPSKKHSGRYDTPEGKRLETVQATANAAKLSEVVPELAGRFRRFPDYLTPPRRYFENSREQWLEFLACIGPGQYQINSADVKVGDTPITSLGADGYYQVFSPGVDLSEITAHQHWHTVDEVGGTSSGTAGLELSTELGNRINTQPTNYTFSGNQITRSDGAYPSGWGNGTKVDITTSKIIECEVSFGNVVSGNFAHLTPLKNGDEVIVNGEPCLAEAVSLNNDGVGTLQLWTVPVRSTGEDDGIPSKPVELQSVTQNIRFTRTQVATIASITSVDKITVDKRFAPFTLNATIEFSDVYGRRDSNVVYGEWTSEFVVTPGNEKTEAVEFDVFFPSGLAYIEDDGSVNGRSVTIEFQVRNLDTDASLSIHRTYNAATLDQIGYTERITVGSGRIACRMRRIGVSSTSTQVQDKLHWYGLKCRLPTRTSYPNWTTISIRLRSGGRLAAQSENKINVVATRILPVLQSNGTWSTPQPTRDISAFIRYIAHSIGYTDDDIDMPELLRLHNIWKSRGETVDHVFDLTTVKSALQVVLGAGMSELTIANGLIRPVRDDIRTQFESGYSPQNMTKPLVRSFKSRRHDDADGVEVEYIDANTWTNQIVICSLPGSQRLKLEKLKLNGVTDRTRAWRIGMRRMRQIAYQNWEYSFDTEMDALNSEYLSYVPLLDDIPGYGQSAILTNVDVAGSNVILTVSEEIQWQGGKDHVVAYRKADGTLAGPWPATKVNDFMIQAPIPVAERPKVSLKMELPHVYIGTTEEWCFPALITEITPRGTDSVSVSAVNYDARIYADDNNYPPN